MLLKDIVQAMCDFVDGKSQVVGNFRFTHAETALPLMMLLGYGSREVLLTSFTDAQIEKRGFLSSELDPFGANIDFRLFQKPDSKSVQQQTKEDNYYYVQVLVNERVTEIPGCDVILCKLSRVEELWAYYLNEYDFVAKCQV